jgi:hypothetical protein
VVKRLTAVLLTVCLADLPAVGADRDWQEEVAHLLDFIARSDCRFIRNDKVYDAAQARDHINRKYEHVKKRISSTEQFITYAASRSSITGKKYQVTCGETTMLSRAWLEEELRTFREAR